MSDLLCSSNFLWGAFGFIRGRRLTKSRDREREREREREKKKKKKKKKKRERERESEKERPSLTAHSRAICPRMQAHAKPSGPGFLHDELGGLCSSVYA